MLKDIKSEFSVTLGQWLGISIGCLLLGLTIIGLPFALCAKQRWITKNTKIVGMKLEFNGTAGSLALNMLKWLGMFVLTFSLYIFVIPMKYRQWVTKNTVFAKY